MPALSPDYDTDPERSRSFRTGWQEDVHQPVAEHLLAEGVESVIDVSCGIDRFAAAVGGHLDWIGVDASPHQLADCPYRPVIRADATRLPVADASVGAVTMLWMLYHLDEPREAVIEAKRVLQRGGLLAACTSSRSNDPELVPQGYPRSTFDAEEAADIVSEVFGAANCRRRALGRTTGPAARLGGRRRLRPQPPTPTDSRRRGQPPSISH